MLSWRAHVTKSIMHTRCYCHVPSTNEMENSNGDEAQCWQAVPLCEIVSWSRHMRLQKPIIGKKVHRQRTSNCKLNSACSLSHTLRMLVNTDSKSIAQRNLRCPQSANDDITKREQIVHLSMRHLQIDYPGRKAKPKKYPRDPCLEGR